MKKVIVGSVLAAGVAASLFGAGTASAAPGISYDNGTGNKIGIGDQNYGTGAYAQAAPGNQALAVSVFKPSTAIVFGKDQKFPGPFGGPGVGTPTGNNVITLDGGTLVSGNAKNNNVVTAYGATAILGDHQGNTVINGGSRVQAVDPPLGKAENLTSVSVCGTTLSAQSSHIVVGKQQGGIC